MQPLFVISFPASLFEQTCPKQYRDDKKCEENKEQYFRNGSSAFSDSAESKYSCNDSDNKKDN